MTRIGMALAAPLFAASIAMMTTAHANDANDKGASKNTQAQLDQSSPAASTGTSTGAAANGDDNATRRNAREPCHGGLVRSATQPPVTQGALNLEQFRIQPRPRVSA